MRSLRLIAGVLLVVIGFLALITPLTPGAWLMFVGLELLGIRLVAWDRIKERLARLRARFHGNDTEASDTANRE